MVKNIKAQGTEWSANAVMDGCKMVINATFINNDFPIPQFLIKKKKKKHKISASKVIRKLDEPLTSLLKT